MDEVIVIGAGLSGLLAAFLANEKGAKVRLIAQGIGSILVTPGWISIADQSDGDVLAGAAAIATESPEHPYALAGLNALQAGVDALRRFGDAIQLPYLGDLSRNMRLPTALGTPQTPALAPGSMAAGDGRAAGALYVGFVGWRDFYPKLAGERTTFIQLPGDGRPWDATPTDLARSFDYPEFRKGVAAGVRHALGGAAAAVGFPAVLGLENPIEAQQDLQDRLGVPVFEMATLPPSVPGSRLFGKARRYFLDHGMRVQVGHPVTRGIIQNGRVTEIEVAAAGKPQRFRADHIILATGGLYGGGLFSDDRGRIWEPLFDLPVQAIADRAVWFNETMLSPDGHPIHRFGVRVNERMQPLSDTGAIMAENLYAVGHIIAQPGKTPTACSAEGVSLATVAKAIQSSLGG